MPSLKTRAVQKVLREDTYRKATEASWCKHSSEIQTLDVLQRCRRLNQFLAQGLLSEIEETESSIPRLGTKAATAGQLHAIGLQQQGAKPGIDRRAAGQLSRTKSSSSSALRQPLADRITAKESAALLELLAEQEPQPDGIAPSEDATATSSGKVADNTLPTAGIAVCQVSLLGSAAALHLPSLEADEFDIIDLVNSSSVDPSAENQDIRAVLQQLYAEQQEQAALCIQCAFRCQQAYQQFQHMQTQAASVRRQLATSEDTKQESGIQQLAHNHKQNCISSAWRGYYGYWGADAACTIQQHWRRHVTSNQYKQLREAAVVLQAFVRGWLFRHSPDNPIPTHRQQQQQRLEHQLKQEQLRQQRQAAAVVLQCCVRGWRTRKQLHAELARATCCQAKTAAKDGCFSDRSQHAGHGDGMQEEDGIAVLRAINLAPVIVQSDPDNCSTSSPALSLRCSSTPGGSSDDLGDQSGSRQAVYAEVETHGSDSLNRQWSSSGSFSGVLQSSVQKPPQRQHVRQLSKKPSTQGLLNNLRHATFDELSCNGATSDIDALQARQLIVRCAADTRTANQHRNSCDTVRLDADGLTAEFIQRAAELSLGEDLQQVELSVRATMASSSFRGLREAMLVVKSKLDVL